MMCRALRQCGHTLIEGRPGPETDIYYSHGSPYALAGLGTTNARVIAYWVCEATDLQPRYHENIDKVDDLWTASSFCSEVFDLKLNRDAKVIPHCVDRYNYQPRKNDVPVILIPFDYGSRFERKNPIASVRACRDAFGENCQIILKARNAPGPIVNWLIQEAAPAPVKPITNSLSADQLYQLYVTPDIVLSLHHSEGFGLHLLEAMAHGKKVVASDFGGSRDFVNGGNAYPVTTFESSVNDNLFKGNWGYPLHEHAVEQLRSAYEDDFTKCEKAFRTALNLSQATTALHTFMAL